ncbi:MAG: carbohydrate porin [Bdellovibrionales bacterium]|nr:carbohydrate porin [Bdellovibrionales bacterium]
MGARKNSRMRLRAAFGMFAFVLANRPLIARADDTSDVLQSFDNFKIEKKKPPVVEVPKEPTKEIPSETSKDVPKKIKKARKKTEAPAPEKPAEATAVIPPPTAPTPPPTPESEPEFGLLGSWMGGKSYLSARGLDLSLVLKNEASHNFSGGVDQGTGYLTNLDLRLAGDAEKLMGWTGGSFMVYILGNAGADSARNPARYVGDEQSVSNIQSDTDTLRLYEFWVQQNFAEGKISFLAGLHDLNSEFYATDSAGLFFNSSFGIGRELSQTGEAGPSVFPHTSTALRLKTQPTANFYLQTGIFNSVAGDPDHPKSLGFHLSDKGYLFIGELGVLGDDAERPLKYAFGVWTYTTPFDRIDTVIIDVDGRHIAPHSVSNGAYLLADQALSKSWSAFLRYGITSPYMNNVIDCLSGGLVHKGGFGSSDRMGVGFAMVRAGAPYAKILRDDGAQVAAAEVAIELNYRAEVFRGIAVQPDFQYILHPGFVSPNAVYGALRLELNL